MPITIDVETSVGFDQARAATNNKFLNLNVMAERNWIAVTSQNGMIRHWRKHQQQTLLEFLASDVVNGWNVLEFDVPLIQISAHRPGAKWHIIKTEDLFDLARVGSKSKERPGGIFYSMDEVAQLNLKQGKLMPSADIPALFASNLPKVFEQCQDHVKLEAALYALASGEGLVLPAKTDGIGTCASWTLKLSSIEG